MRRVNFSLMSPPSPLLLDRNSESRFFQIIIIIISTEFCCSEKGELLTMRLKILCEDRCEDIAVNLAAACVRSLRRSDRLRSLSDSHHVHYMIDVYIVLLYKLKRTQDIFAQVSTQG